MAEAYRKAVPPLAKTSEGKATEVEKLVAPSLEAMGYDIVRVQLTSGQHGHLQVMIERRDGAAVIVDDCASASRAIEAILDVEDPIPGAYELEVSSPGIDRPLTRLSDFERFAGFEAKVEMLKPHDGRKRFRGRLLGLDGTTVRLNVENEEEIQFAFTDIAKAKLVITDDLIAANRDADNEKRPN